MRSTLISRSIAAVAWASVVLAAAVHAAPLNPAAPPGRRQASCSSVGFTPKRRGLAIVDGVTGFTVTLYTNNGSGNFTRGDTFTSDSPISGVAAGNFIGTRNTQIAINQNHSLAILIVSPNGSFTSSQSTQPWYGRPVDLTFGNAMYKFVVADINNDGLSDIVATALVAPGQLGNSLGVSSFISLSSGGSPGNVSFQQATGLSEPGTGLYSTIAVGDLDGDGYPDAVVVSGNLDSKLHIFFNRYQGGGWVQNIVPISPNPYMALGHFYERTGTAKDVALSTSFNLVQTFLGGVRPAGGLQYPAPFGLNDLIGQMVAADLNNDGFDELVALTNYGPIVWSNGGGIFDTVGQLYPLEYLTGDARALQGVVIADFNGDGNPDFAVVRHQNDINGLQIFLNNCPSYQPTPSSTSSGAAAPPTSTVTVTVPAVTITAPGTTVTVGGTTTVATTITASGTTVTATKITSIVQSQSSRTVTVTVPVTVTKSTTETKSTTITKSTTDTKSTTITKSTTVTKTTTVH